jgi:UDP-glucose 6-dehydrogenase
MRILVLGAGALGLIFGGRAAEAGHDVAFLCRHDRRVIGTFGDVAVPCINAGQRVRVQRGG